jgi:hypothetical protein
MRYLVFLSLSLALELGCGTDVAADWSPAYEWGWSCKSRSTSLVDPCRGPELSDGGGWCAPEGRCWQRCEPSYPMGVLVNTCPSGGTMRTATSYVYSDACWCDLAP